MTSESCTESPSEIHKNRSRGVIRNGAVFLDVLAEGEGPLVVLIPSSGRDSMDYDECAELLAKFGYRVLRPQPRGMLGSTGQLNRITFHDYADDIAAVITNQGGGPAIVVGHAFGNWIARTVAVNHPHLVKGVVLAAAAAIDIPTYLFEHSRKSADPTLSNEERVQNLLKAFFVREADALKWLVGWHLEARKAQSNARRATNPADWVAAGMAPLLDLQAELDPWRPRETVNELKDLYWNRVTIEIIPDASHALLPEQPELVANHIVAWDKKL